MFERLKDDWRRFKQSEPGCRFQERYDRKHEGRSGGRPGARNVLRLAAGIGLMLAGAAMMVAPGPGLLALALGAGLIAQQSRALSRFLDRAEVWLRKVAGQARAFWRRASPPAKAAIGLLGLVLAASAGYGAYHLLFDSPG